MNRFPIFRNGGIIWAQPGIKVTAKELERLIFKHLKRSKQLEKLKELKEANKGLIKDTRDYYGTGENRKYAKEINDARKRRVSTSQTTPVKTWEESIDYSLPERTRPYSTGATKVPWQDFYDWDEIEWQAD